MTDYYASATGTGDGTIGNPCSFSVGATIGEAGDTLFLRAGTYTGLEAAGGNPTFSSGANFTNSYTVKAYPGETVTITTGSEFCLPIENCSYVIFDGLILDGVGGYNCAKIRYGAHHIRLINIEAKNSTYSGILVTDEVGAGYNEFINLIAHNNGTRATFDHGIYLSAPYNLVENGQFYDNAAFGIQMDQGTSANNIIRYNRVYSNSRVGNGGGIVVADGEDNLVAYNLIYDNGDFGIYVAYGATDTSIFNNTCVDGAYWYTGTRGEVRNNIITGTAKIELTSSITLTNNLTLASIVRISDTGTTLSDNLIDDPQFVNDDVNDYRLLATSPAINAGISVGLTRDFDGNALDGLPDIGAYEYLDQTVIRLAYHLS